MDHGTFYGISPLTEISRVIVKAHYVNVLLYFPTRSIGEVGVERGAAAASDDFQRPPGGLLPA